MFKFFLVVCFCLLQACGSGGTPATLGQINFTEGGPYIPFVAMNTGLMSTQVTDADPNKSVSTSSSTYDLRWSTPDNSGPSYSNAYFYGSWKPTTHLKIWGQTLTASCSSKDYSSCAPASYERPHEDVITALHQGWTGKGVNILIEDSLSGENFFHGINTGLIASRNAPGATIYGLDNANSSTVFDNQLGGRPSAGYANTINVGVVNASYGTDLEKMIGRKQSDGAWTALELLQARNDYSGASFVQTNKYKDLGKSGDLLQFKYSDAVIVQASGNETITVDGVPNIYYLAIDTAIQPRLLIVGSVSSNGSVAKPAVISSYSNTAGNDADLKNRYLLAFDATLFESGQAAFNGTPLTKGVGSSYAAPRVSAYVAIVRSKFPNLNASKTASILLDTARYDTLACFKTAAGCDPTTYGKGEASLSRALAPVGRLR